MYVVVTSRAISTAQHCRRAGALGVRLGSSTLRFPTALPLLRLRNAVLSPMTSSAHRCSLRHCPSSTRSSHPPTDSNPPTDMNNHAVAAANGANPAPNLAQQIGHIQLHMGAGANNDAIPNSWLVQFKKDTPDGVIYDVIKDVNANGGKVTFHYNTIYHGFSAHIPPTYLDNVRGHPQVEKVTPNYKVRMIEPIDQPKLELM